MINKSDKILITGATGLIGSYITRKLFHSGYRNIIATKRSTSKTDLLADICDKIEWKEVDVTSVISLEPAFVDIDIVIHTAAIVSYDPSHKNIMYDINVNGTANMVNLALSTGVKKFVHISSVAALGKSESNISSESTEWDSTVPTTDYAISKYKSEKEVWRGFAEGLPAVIINPSFVLAPGYWDKTSTAIWSKMAKGVPYYPLGTNGYVDVRDVVSSIMVLLNNDIIGERFVISAESLSYKEIFTLIAKSIHAKIPSRALTPIVRSIAWRLDWLRSKITNSSQILTKSSAESTSRKTHYDNKKSITELNIDYTPISESIAEIGLLFLESKKLKHNYNVYNIESM